MSRKAVAHIRKSDPIMAEIMGRAGAFAPSSSGLKTPFESLVRAVAHQQLHGKAAETILGRFKALYPGKRFPKPADVIATPPTQLRGVGFSEAKVLAIRDIAAKTIEGVVPSLARIQKMDDEEIVERLMQVRGVGRWTVEMLLIFQLGRLNVLPVDDFGVRNGFRIAYKKRKMPTPKQLRQFGVRWHPYRTVAAWYLWRAADLSKIK
jgi:DNA-3-methyladenine glycosylase II